ncbi:MAG: response regulator transcription factor [Opitutaceae bacterium]|nr:response regulator transcription factor [Opitutaceae bacterium]
MTPAKKTVWLVEDNTAFSRVIARMIDAISGMSCTAKFCRCEDALAQLESPAVVPPNIVLLDVGLPGMSGLDGIARIRELSPSTQVVILTVFDDDEKIYRAICAGASGYLLKGAAMDDLAAALRQAVLGGAPMAPRVARRVLEMFSRLAPKENLAMALSPRERQVVEGMAAGLTNKEIAAKLGLSAHTTDGYTRQIYEKLHVKSRSGAVAKAMHNRLFETG